MFIVLGMYNFGLVINRVVFIVSFINIYYLRFVSSENVYLNDKSLC